MPEPFEALADQIDESYVLLGSDDPADRREAVYQLGEMGYEEAIPDLVKIYKEDPHPSVRKAAAYALGMFVAASKANEKQLAKYYEPVVMEGKLGHRANTGGLIRTILGLALSLAVLGALYVLLPGLLPNGGINASSLGLRAAAAPEKDRATLINELTVQFEQVRDDTTQLQGQFTGLLGGRSLDCAAFFNNPQPYTLSAASAAAYPDLAGIAVDLNAALTNFTNAYSRYDQACSGARPLPPAEVGPILRTLLPSLEAMPMLETSIEAVSGEVTTPSTTPTSIPPTIAPGQTSPPGQAAPQPTTVSPTTAAATVVPPTAVSPTDAPAATAVPPTTEGGEVANPRRHLTALYAIVDDVTSPLGASTLLVQSWEDAQNAGRNYRCPTRRPNIPSNYVVLPEIDALQSRNLAQAVQLINTGLNAVRDGWANFENACATGTLSTATAPGLASARTAANAFTAAQQFLNNLRDS